MRAAKFLVLAFLAVAVSSAVANELEALESASRQLLQGGAAKGSSVRPFSGVAQHKTPQAPKLTRKNFERKAPGGGKRLLSEDAIDAGLEAPTRQLLQGGAAGGSSVRPFSKVAAHKTPQAPKLTRKNFERKAPGGGKRLLSEDAIDAGLEAPTRQLLQGGAAGGSSVRPFSKVAAHKTPQAPNLSRKNFERKAPGGGKRLLSEDAIDAGLEAPTRQLLQGGAAGGSSVRPFSKVAAHKTPQAPKLSRKNFERKAPGGGKRLLSEDAIDAGLEAPTRQLLQGGAAGGSSVRPFSKVAAHKTPQAPKLTRKNFERKAPGGGKRLLSEDAIDAALESASRQLLQGGAAKGSSVRPFSSAAQHKTPQAPKLTRKSFELKSPVSGKRLLSEDAIDAGFEQFATRQLLQGGAAGGSSVRSFSGVAQHKTPQAPKLTRKNFDRAGP